MHWHSTINPARSVARIARWLLPWASVLLLSGAVAHGLEQAVERTSYEMPQPVGSTASRWVTLGSVNADKSVTSLNCLARPDIVTSDALYVRAEDFDAVVWEVCSEVWL